MAKFAEINEAEWKEWVATCPPVIQALCERLPPDRLYRLKTTGQRVILHSYAESGTVSVNVLGDVNACVFERQVFGINPDDLEECELPGPDEPLGAMLTEEADIEAYVERLRAEEAGGLFRIVTERQYRITQRAAENFQCALAAMAACDFKREGIDPRLIQAEREAMESQLAELQAALAAYKDAERTAQ